jgi:two-component system, sensor histidine kinase and response regulator
VIQYEVLTDLVEIKTSQNQTLLHELVEMFSVQTPLRLDQIEQAIKQKNAAEILRTVHTLKASCAYLGAKEMAALCMQIEKWGHEKNNGHDMQVAEVYLSALEESFEESIE